MSFTPTEAGYKDGEIVDIDDGGAKGIEIWTHRNGGTEVWDVENGHLMRVGEQEYVTLDSGQCVPTFAVIEHPAEDATEPDPEPATPEPATTGNSDDDGLEAKDMTGDKLTEIAKAEGVKGLAKSAKKADKVAAIRAHRAAAG